MLLVDSHCHLNLLDLSPGDGDIDAVIARAKACDIHYLLNVCVSIKAFEQVLATAQQYPFVSASVGLHPNERSEDVDLKTLIALACSQKVVAIGETGLDYFRSEEPLDWQRERFALHIEAAKNVQKPLIVHTRAAKRDTINILRESLAQDIGGVMHCFTEDWSMAKEALDLGFYISFSGIVTFKNATSIQEVAKKVPLERMLIETDAPYLAPHPYRGKPNEPAFLRKTAECLADLRQIPLEVLAEHTTQNFFNLFKPLKE